MDVMFRGGPLMWPILLESILALWFIIERSVFVFSVLPRKRRALDILVEATGNEGQEPADISLTELSGLGKAVGKAREQGVLNLSLLNLQAEKLIGEAERHLIILHIIAQSAPLLGLLGTVTGMIQAFIRIQELGGQVNPSDLAGGIWQALTTTAAGLIVAIPALIAYIAFGRLADRFASEVAAAVSQIAHKLSRSGMEVV